MAALFRCGPGEVVDVVVHRQRHQLVVGGMEARLVHAAAVAVERQKFGRVAVGEFARFQDLFRADDAAQRLHARVEPGAGLAQNGFAQGRIDQIEVLAREFGGLVGHFMGCERGRGCEAGHGL